VEKEREREIKRERETEKQRQRQSQRERERERELQRDISPLKIGIIAEIPARRERPGLHIFYVTFS
jgi:hypothetical protein